MALGVWAGRGHRGRRGAAVAFGTARAGEVNRQLRVGNEDGDPFLAEHLLPQVASRIQFFLFKMEIFHCNRR